MSKTESSQEKRKIRELINSQSTRVHFIGVGGVGMYSLFCYLDRLGYCCTGSDRQNGELFSRLKSSGKRVTLGARENNVIGADIVVASSAVPPENPELAFSKKEGLIILTRAELLGMIVSLYEKSIGVSGTHGKSTVTAMIHSILKKRDAGCDCISGSLLSKDGEPFSLNGSTTLVYEACEYKDSFLSFYPEYSVFLNLELDHTDYFKDIDALKRSFLSASNNARTLVINADDYNLSEIANKTEARTVLFGKSESSHYRIEDITENRGKYSFSIREVSGRVTKIKLNVLGKFQIYNAAAAFALCREMGALPELIKAALEEFSQIPRRLEVIGKYKEHKLYYDYAHHPSEIRAGIEAITKADTAPTVIFRPHTYTRTQSLFDGFVKALSGAHRVLILDIDGVREENESGISSAMLAEKIGKGARRVTENTVLEYLDTGCEPIILMGAAYVENIKELLLKGK